MQREQHTERVARGDLDRGHARGGELQVLVAVDRGTQERGHAARGQGPGTVSELAVGQEQRELGRLGVGAGVQDAGLAHRVLQFGVTSDEGVVPRVGRRRLLSCAAEVLRPKVKGVARPIAMEDKHRGE